MRNLCLRGVGSRTAGALQDNLTGLDLRSSSSDGSGLLEQLNLIQMEIKNMKSAAGKRHKREIKLRSENEAVLQIRQNILAPRSAAEFEMFLNSFTRSDVRLHLIRYKLVCTFVETKRW